ncbi:hypothetical protein H9P43_002437 [Blastocladiella emersonii ATCC 22665]|nr:hypothetical protein H9P43_002437 [Blastocladiella emersonii ATCC 22665]
MKQPAGRRPARRALALAVAAAFVAALLVTSPVHATATAPETGTPTTAAGAAEPTERQRRNPAPAPAPGDVVATPACTQVNYRFADTTSVEPCTTRLCVTYSVGGNRAVTGLNFPVSTVGLVSIASDFTYTRAGGAATSTRMTAAFTGATGTLTMTHPTVSVSNALTAFTYCFTARAGPMPLSVGPNIYPVIDGSTCSLAAATPIIGGFGCNADCYIYPPPPNFDCPAACATISGTTTTSPGFTATATRTLTTLQAQLGIGTSCPPKTTTCPCAPIPCVTGVTVQSTTTDIACSTTQGPVTTKTLKTFATVVTSARFGGTCSLGATTTNFETKSCPPLPTNCVPNTAIPPVFDCSSACRATTASNPTLTSSYPYTATPAANGGSACTSATSACACSKTDCVQGPVTSRTDPIGATYDCATVTATTSFVYGAVYSTTPVLTSPAHGGSVCPATTVATSTLSASCAPVDCVVATVTPLADRCSTACSALITPPPGPPAENRVPRTLTLTFPADTTPTPAARGGSACPTLTATCVAPCAPYNCVLGADAATEVIGQEDFSCATVEAPAPVETTYLTRRTTSAILTSAHFGGTCSPVAETMYSTSCGAVDCTPSVTPTPTTACADACAADEIVVADNASPYTATLTVNYLPLTAANRGGAACTPATIPCDSACSAVDCTLGAATASETFGPATYDCQDSDLATSTTFREIRSTYAIARSARYGGRECTTVSKFPTATVCPPVDCTPEATPTNELIPDAECSAACEAHATAYNDNLGFTPTLSKSYPNTVRAAVRGGSTCPLATRTCPACAPTNCVVDPTSVVDVQATGPADFDCATVVATAPVETTYRTATTTFATAPPRFGGSTCSDHTTIVKSSTTCSAVDCVGSYPTDLAERCAARCVADNAQEANYQPTLTLPYDVTLTPANRGGVACPTSTHYCPQCNAVDCVLGAATASATFRSNPVDCNTLAGAEPLTTTWFSAETTYAVATGPRNGGTCAPTKTSTEVATCTATDCVSETIAPEAFDAECARKCGVLATVLQDNAVTAPMATIVPATLTTSNFGGKTCTASESVCPTCAAIDCQLGTATVIDSPISTDGPSTYECKTGDAIVTHATLYATVVTATPARFGGKTCSASVVSTGTLTKDCHPTDCVVSGDPVFDCAGACAAATELAEYAPVLETTYPVTLTAQVNSGSACPAAKTTCPTCDPVDCVLSADPYAETTRDVPVQCATLSGSTSAATKIATKTYSTSRAARLGGKACGPTTSVSTVGYKTCGCDAEVGDTATLATNCAPACTYTAKVQSADGFYYSDGIKACTTATRDGCTSINPTPCSSQIPKTDCVLSATPSCPAVACPTGSPAASTSRITCEYPVLTSAANGGTACGPTTTASDVSLYQLSATSCSASSIKASATTGTLATTTWAGKVVSTSTYVGPTSLACTKTVSNTAEIACETTVVAVVKESCAANPLGISTDFNAVFYNSFAQSSGRTEGRLAIGGAASLSQYSVAEGITPPLACDAVALVVGGTLSYPSGRVFSGSIRVGATAGSTVGSSVLSGLRSCATFSAASPNLASVFDFVAHRAAMIALANTLSALPETLEIAPKPEWGARVVRRKATPAAGDKFEVLRIAKPASSGSADMPEINWATVVALTGASKDRTLIINLDARVAIRGNDYTKLINSGIPVVWNFGSAATSAEIKWVTLPGFVLAPNAKVSGSGTVNGFVVAKDLDGAATLSFALAKDAMGKLCVPPAAAAASPAGPTTVTVA